MRLLTFILVIAGTMPTMAQFIGAPLASAHRRGPHGLEAWTLNEKVVGHGEERYPVTLVIARNRRILQRVKGNAFIWNWMFQDDGQRVAYESGPFHFGLTCVLGDVATGKQLADYDCFAALPEDAPVWVKTLEAPEQQSSLANCLMLVRAWSDEWRLSADQKNEVLGPVIILTSSPASGLRCPYTGKEDDPYMQNSDCSGCTTTREVTEA